MTYEILLSALRLQGYTAVEARGGVTKIIPEAEAITAEVIRRLQDRQDLLALQQCQRGRDVGIHPHIHKRIRDAVGVRDACRFQFALQNAAMGAFFARGDRRFRLRRSR